ncbi:MAG TPA: isoaspartyl peptidase/L-asparaginase [Steroidobacteraceae bacterium]|nr:isoaspartyl peptidase/L-asparaginase [Steroidobacteraceae bacterium]
MRGRSTVSSVVCLVTAALLLPFTAADASDYRHYVTGDLTAPAPGKVSGGLLLMGGGDRNFDALRWFVAKAGHGHLVVLRASQAAEVADEFYTEVGGLASVETFVFEGRGAASDPKILAALAQADGIFIAGGDQARYVRFWKGTPVAAALDAHVAAGKPLGGTSAGLAILGEYLYGAMDDGSITSPEAMADPLGPAVTLEGDFLHLALLRGIVTDTHFKERNRQGRLLAFLAKADRPLWGLGVDESAALAVEPDGTARIYATDPDGAAWLYKGGFSERQDAGKPLHLRRVTAIGIGHGSVLHLVERRVDQPVFQRAFTVVDGRLSEVPLWSLAIHGGAGVIERGKLPAQAEQAYRASLEEALRAGGTVLAANGSALDAVEAVVRVLEDNPLFNAGRGAVFTADGRNELDAAIMDGATEKAGAVAGVTRTRHPVSLARAVMEKSPHVMLARDGADRFSLEAGLEQVDPSWFRTEERWQQLLQWRAKRKAAVALDPTHAYGTVGAVALDSAGHLAAATSTGGTTGKRWGRIGDSPIIGAGTYAKDGACAVSATGTGEYFIRESAARQVCDRVTWQGSGIVKAAHDTIMAVGAIGGDGGLIAMGADGTPAFAINDLGMYRGRIAAGAPPRTAVYADEKFAD